MVSQPPTPTNRALAGDAGETTSGEASSKAPSKNKSREMRARQREPAGAWIRESKGTIFTAPMLPVHSRQRGAAMMIRFACFGAFFVAFALTGPASATGGCGVGCSSTSEGACVRDGWQQGLPVRNVCPATSQPSPPCGPYHRWSRQSMMCIPR